MRYGKPEPKICTHCGKEIAKNNQPTKGAISKIMQNTGMCYECAYWTNFMDSPPPYLEIIGGTCYNVCPMAKRVPNAMLGSKNTKYILRKDGSVERSNDIWNLGDVPLSFRNKLRDTAYWVDKRIYDRLKDFGLRRCKAKGCMDRYHCLQFDYRIEFDEGPYNIVPITWIVGDENCKDFINMLKIRGFDNYYDINDIIFNKNGDEEIFSRESLFRASDVAAKSRKGAYEEDCKPSWD